MNEQMAKQLVVRAGMELVESGLIARTWGNVSCRVDDEMFAITPSGRSYETLTVDEIVLCRTEDTAYEGEIKPSSEKGIHALIYQTYPDINFVIHTHQPMASAISSVGINKMPSFNYDLLGEGVPVAAYGLPGTKKLREGIKKALAQNKGHAVIMSNHGALCFGKDYDATFSAAKQLEEACFDFMVDTYLKASGEEVYEEQQFFQYYISKVTEKSLSLPFKPITLYNSRRTPEGLILEGLTETAYRIGDTMPPLASIHMAIYQKRKDINFISQETDHNIFAISLTNTPLSPLLDDFAQIVGYTARCAKSTKSEDILKALKGRMGVIVPAGGALCCAATKSDLHAVQLVMKKDAMAQIGARIFGGVKAINPFDCYLMHLVYTKSYAKKAKSS
jgi:L-fuculose-phosphate aldolase